MKNKYTEAKRIGSSWNCFHVEGCLIKELVQADHREEAVQAQTV
jgi:hypothetical protein